MDGRCEFPTRPPGWAPSFLCLTGGAARWPSPAPPGTAPSLTPVPQWWVALTVCRGRTEDTFPRASCGQARTCLPAGAGAAPGPHAASSERARPSLLTPAVAECPSFPQQTFVSDRVFLPLGACSHHSVQTDFPENGSDQLRPTVQPQSLPSGRAPKPSCPTPRSSPQRLTMVAGR